MNKLKYSRLFAIVILLTTNVFSLFADDIFEKNTVIKAMTDELKRSIDSLHYDGFQKPFFIGYTLATGNYIQVYASNGAIVTSTKRVLNSNFTRVMVGDYQLNDENFIDTKRRRTHNDGKFRIPIDGGYWGIRRSFWLSTNNIYKNAAESYKNKCAAMAHKQLDENEIVIADFSKEMPIKLDSYTSFDSLDLSLCENITKQISSVFNDYPSIYKNEVRLFEQKANVFFVNTEGSEVIVPISVFGLLIKAFSYTDDYQSLGQFRSYIFNSITELPSIDRVKADTENMITEIEEMRQLDVFEDSYLGPILFCHQAVPEYLIYDFFKYGNGVLAQRSNLVNDSRSGLRNSTARTWENRLGKRVVDRSLSLYSVPSISQYGNSSLIGDYKIDGEGVVPKDSLILIEKGVLKHLLIGRTPLEKVTNSSGSNRYSIRAGAVFRTEAPGNVILKSDKTFSELELKKKLIAIAVDDGLDYAIIVKSKGEGLSHQGVFVYKVNLNDGSEELIRSANLTKINLESLWEIEGASNENDVFNVLFNTHSNRNNSSVSTEVFSGVPVSFIYPNSVLIKRGAVEGRKKPLKGITPLVPSPL